MKCKICKEESTLEEIMAATKYFWQNKWVIEFEDLDNHELLTCPHCHKHSTKERWQRV